MNLYYDAKHYLYYEGESLIVNVAWPNPILLTVNINPESGAIVKGSYDSSRLVFREDSFDPVTRIRRGRIYKHSNINSVVYLNPHSVRTRHPDERIDDCGRIFVNYGLSTFLSVNPLDKDIGIKLNQVIEVGTKGATTRWRILAVEQSMSPGNYLLTLRALSYYGVLPEINVELLPENGREKVLETLEKVSENAHRAGPESVIDRCRDAASAIFGAYCSKYDEKKMGKDLQNLINYLRNKEEEKGRVTLLNSAHTIARLHARAKPNEQIKYNPRLITERDGIYAIECLAMIIRELGYQYLYR